jgi:hypothetical protein
VAHYFAVVFDKYAPQRGAQSGGRMEETLTLHRCDHCHRDVPTPGRLRKTVSKLSRAYLPSLQRPLLLDR